MEKLSAIDIHILIKAKQLGGFNRPRELFTRKDASPADVFRLCDGGLLRKRLDKYAITENGIAAIEQMGCEVETEKKPRIVKQEPREESEIPDYLTSPEKLIEASLLIARERAKSGNPFDLIRIQFPALVIKDPIDLHFFRKHCKRDRDLDLRLDDKQYRFLSCIFDRHNKEVAIKGCTSPGKGFAAALAINLWYDIWKEDRIILVSPTSQHAKTIMFAEVCKIRKMMKHQDKDESFLTQSAKDLRCTTHTIEILNPDSGEGVSGAHGKNTLYVFDESSSVPDELVKNARSPARMIIAISNPRTLSGWFHDLFPAVDPDTDQDFVVDGIPRATVTFGGDDCINVKAKRLNDPTYSPPGGLHVELLDGTTKYVPEGVAFPKDLIPYVRPLIPAQLDIAKYSSFMQIRDANEVAWRVHGKFPPEDAESQVVPPSWLVKPVNEWKLHRDEIEVTAFGLDLGGSEDGDPSILACGGWKGIKCLFAAKRKQSSELMQWLRNCEAQLGVGLFDGSCPIAVDTIGVGGELFCQQLEEAGCVVVRCTGSMSSDVNPHKYQNKRAELYGEFADRLDPGSDHLDVFMVVDDKLLHEELAAHEKFYDTTGERFKLTPKSPKSRERHGGVRLQTIKEKIGRSPDRSDAVVMCYAAICQSAETGTFTNQFDPSKVAISSFTRNDQRVYVSASGHEINAPESEIDFLDIEAERRLFEACLPGAQSPAFWLG